MLHHTKVEADLNGYLAILFLKKDKSKESATLDKVSIPIVTNHKHSVLMLIKWVFMNNGKN